MSLATGSMAPRVIAVLRAAAPEQAPARDVPPDITSAAHWSGAVVGATLWALFILYAASRSVG
jgi:hypothetical protein